MIVMTPLQELNIIWGSNNQNKLVQLESPAFSYIFMYCFKNLILFN